MAVQNFQDVEKQLQQRRLDVQTLQAAVKTLQGQLATLQTSVTTDETNITALQNAAAPSTGADGTWNGSAVVYKLASLFSAAVTFAKSVKLSFISTAGPLKVSALGVVSEGTIDLANTSETDITGVLPVAHGGTGLNASPITVPLGGTGLATLTTGDFLVGNGAGAVSLVGTPLTVPLGGTGQVAFSTGGSGYPITSNGTGALAANSAMQFGSSTIAFWGGSLASKQTLAAYTPNAPVHYGGLAANLAGAVYASVINLNDLQDSYNNLRLMCEDMRTKLQASTFVG